MGIYREPRTGTWYGDFRQYADVGGKREALGTKLKQEAERRHAARLSELLSERAVRAAGTPHPPRRLVVDYAAEVRAAMRQSGNYAPSYLADLELSWARFARSPAVSQKQVAEVGKACVAELAGELLAEGKAPATVRRMVMALSVVLSHAVDDGLITVNPVRGNRRVPSARAEAEAEVPALVDVAKVLAHAAERPLRGNPSFHAFLMLLAYTGLRFAEAAGTLVGDIQVEATRVMVRPNAYRRLKSVHARRVVPLWPPLAAVLAPYLEGRKATDLLLPSARGGPLKDIRGGLEVVCREAGVPYINPHAFRHAYASARLQSVERSGDVLVPVAPYTVMRELGHGQLGITARYAHVVPGALRWVSLDYSQLLTPA